MKGMINNWTGERISRTELKKLKAKEMAKIFSGSYEILSAKSLAEVIEVLDGQIKEIEKAILKKVNLNGKFKNLLTVCGIGEILAITIMLETGDIGRFLNVGDYSSYCRCVSSKKISNGKNKGKGNKKNGNKYLAWAYVEAANYMSRFSSKAQSWRQKKASKSGNVVAVKALSNKIARACYHIMKDGNVYNPTKMFG